MKIGVGLFPTESVGRMCELTRLAEDLGYSNAWFGDSQNIWREAYTTIGAAATVTTRIVIGSGVTNPVTRHLTVVASAWATLEEYIPGRVILGIGAADSAVRTVGLRPVRMDALEKSVLALRTLMAGGQYFDETSGSATSLAHSVPAKVPIYLAASGPKLLELAGRIADGVIMLVGIDPVFIQAGINAVEKGLRASERQRADFEVVLWTPTAILEDGAAARALVKAHVARILIRPLPAEFDLDVTRDVEKIRESYNYYQHMRTDATHRNYVPDSLVPSFALAGDPNECARQLNRIVNSGIDQIAIVPYVPQGADRGTVLRSFAQLTQNQR